jgi:DNA-nicking Smr family endonuclease
MTKPGLGKLSDEDRIIWTKVARTTRPLKGKPPLPADEPQAADRAALETLLDEKAPPVAAPQPKPPERKPRPGQHHFDPQTRDKLAKGRLQIDARVDLHGMTQGEAHGLLLSFLHRAYAGGLRYVLVITGKGASFGSEGVLKRAVPAWLATPPFHGLVGSHDSAARQHGGAGAIYVRLRRHNEQRPP